ncbi:MAG: RluA family pseudouridine synthase [Acidobacteriaceae bacterium]|nr:RluA family pseudouridine synthase [Acidobacteriaceae bacterium]
MTLTAEPAHAGKRLDSFLHERLPEFSRSRIQSWIKQDRVLVDGAVLRASYLLRGGETISVDPAALPPLKAQAEELPLTVLYEDQDVIVVDKPAGMVVHAGAGHASGTLVNALLHRFGALSELGGELRPGIVHRLDRDTSGVLVVARTDRAHQSLAAQFRNRQVEKTYLALVHGCMKAMQGRITAPIARDPLRRTRMTAKLPSGRAAVTEYRVLEELGALSYLEVRIATGRTHQIRVHLASIRHPVVGDRLYGAPAQIPGLPALGRFFLHAHRLRFTSPSTGNPIAIESPLPPELLAFLRSVRQNTDRIKAVR